MKKILFGIFAHPDDEAFGPAGTLMQEVANGTEVHLITLTLGEAGQNPDNIQDLMDTREKEWREAGHIIGAKKLHYLGYKDSLLTNQSMIEIGEKLVELITRETVSASADTTIELMSIDLNGVTGHIDHIVAGRAACWAFYTLKNVDNRLHRLRLACIPWSYAEGSNISWLYMEAGRKEDEIDEVVDATGFCDRIIAVMRAHHSQRADCDYHLRKLGDTVGMNYFRIVE